MTTLSNSRHRDAAAKRPTRPAGGLRRIRARVFSSQASYALSTRHRRCLVRTESRLHIFTWPRRELCARRPSKNEGMDVRPGPSGNARKADKQAQPFGLPRPERTEHAQPVARALADTRACFRHVGSATARKLHARPAILPDHSRPLSSRRQRHDETFRHRSVTRGNVEWSTPNSASTVFHYGEPSLPWLPNQEF